MRAPKASPEPRRAPPRHVPRLLGAYLLILNLVVLPLTVSSYSVRIGARGEECFVLPVTAGTPCSADFETLDGARVSVTVVGPRRYELYNASDVPSGLFRFDAVSSGDYFMCLRNTQDSPVTVGFALRGGVAPEPGQAPTLVEAVGALADDLVLLRDHERYMQEREDLHRRTLESTNVRVFIWTIVEALVLIGLAVAQMISVTRFFEVVVKI